MNFLRSKDIQGIVDEFMSRNSMDKSHTLVPFDRANLDSLSPRRVRNLLVVSSLYDLYMFEEDGGLVEGLSLENSPLSQAVAPPRLIHATNVVDALEMIEDSTASETLRSNPSADPFDLVICFLRVHESDFNLFDFIQRVKVAAPRLPILLLATDLKQLKKLDPRVDESCRVNVQKTRTWESKKQGIWSWPFLWQGDFSLIHAMIKTVEDRLNMRHDAKIGDVNAIVLVEDNVLYYSSFLPIIYKEIFTLTSSYIQDQHNLALKLRGLRSRLKILLATTYEEALEFFNSFPNNIVGLVSDIGFPCDGKHDEHAGIKLAKYVRNKYPNLPIIMQSALPQNEPIVAREFTNVAFINKNDPKLLSRVRSFLLGPMGFGSFYFKMPDGRVIAKAEGLRSLIDSFETVPPESIFYHLERNDFQRWLLTHGKQDLGMFLKNFNTDEFVKTRGSETLPGYLAKCLRKLTERGNVGIVRMTDCLQAGPKAIHLPSFLSIGSGSLGGKGRSLGFFNSVLLRNGIPSLLEELNVRIRVPRTLVLATNVFDTFLRENDLLERALNEGDDNKVIELFLERSLPDEELALLSRFLSDYQGPLAVRSSSLFEDAYEKPFAGVYKTCLVPNNQDDLATRLHCLHKYILLIYGSTYLQEAKKYARTCGKRMEEERMAVLIQELVGFPDKGLYHPSFSGVMRSYDLYAKDNQNPKDGVCFLAPGFGGTVVDGGPSLQFNPRNPEVIVSGSSLTAERLSLRLSSFSSSSSSSSLSSSSSSPTLSFSSGSPSSPSFPFNSGQKDGSQLSIKELEKIDIAKTVYPSVKDVYLKFYDNSFIGNAPSISESQKTDDEDYLFEDVHGTVLDCSTFESLDDDKDAPPPGRGNWVSMKLSEVIQKSLFSFPSIASLLLNVGSKAMANPVEIEYAVVLPQKETDPMDLTILQIRPMATILSENIYLQPDSLPPNDKCVLWSEKSLGHGRLKDVRDIIFVDPSLFDLNETPLVAEQVGDLAETLNLHRRPYILIGPGRWGTASVKTGIPVTWSQISGVSCIVETDIGNKWYEPSQGSHFFQNLTSFGVGHMTMNLQEDRGFVNYEWLRSINPKAQKGCVKHISFEETAEVIMDSLSSCGAILKPGVPYQVVGQVNSFLEMQGMMWN